MNCNRTGKTLISFSIAVFILLFLLCGCESRSDEIQFSQSKGTVFKMGFGVCDISIPQGIQLDELYIAGYHNGWHPEGVLDLQQARAVWLGTDNKSGDLEGILIISIDSVGLGSDTISTIQQEVGKCLNSDKISINVCSTHDHAGVDTLGLWGPIAKDGKNKAFMDSLVNAAVLAAKEAYNDSREGLLFYGQIQTENMQRDSRDPQVFDDNLYQLRFVPNDGSQNIRIISYAAHAEALRGDNKLISRDWPGAMADFIKQTTGDDTLFLQGAIGGLVMTSVQTQDKPFDAVKNMTVTGEALAQYALSIKDEQIIEPRIRNAKTSLNIQLDNILYMYYRFLGILGNPMTKKAGNYILESTASAIGIGDVVMYLIPGEIFPEIWAELSLTGLPIGLANDEIGYIVPEIDFELDTKLPYIDSKKGHYEETNSCGPNTAQAIVEALKNLESAMLNGN